MVELFRKQLGKQCGTETVRQGKRMFVERYVWNLRKTTVSGVSTYTASVKSTKNDRDWYETKVEVNKATKHVDTYACACAAAAGRACSHLLATVCAIQCDDEGWSAWSDLPTDGPPYVNPNNARMSATGAYADRHAVYTFAGPIGPLACLQSEIEGRGRLNLPEFDDFFDDPRFIRLGSTQGGAKKRSSASKSQGGHKKKQRTEQVPASFDE